jgi:SAM-dependent methyltransferase
LVEVEWNCPVCDAESKRVLRVQREFQIRECSACKHRFAEWKPARDHVSAIYGDDYFFGGGAGYPDYLEEGELLRAHARRYSRLISKYVRPGALLDIGAASGFLCDGFRSAGWQPEGLEPNQTMATYGRDQLHLTFHSATLETFNGTRQYDLITMIQVLAHFTNLRCSMRNAAALTRDGGFWLIETWDSQSLTARVFGQHWHEYNPPSVLQYFNRRSLELLAAQHGFQRVAQGHPGKRIMWRHARSLLDHQVPWPWFHHATKLLPDTTVFPYPSEDLVWMLFKKKSGV